jgi:hypothetical protein
MFKYLLDQKIDITYWYFNILTNAIYGLIKILCEERCIEALEQMRTL